MHYDIVLGAWTDAFSRDMTWRQMVLAFTKEYKVLDGKGKTWFHPTVGLSDDKTLDQHNSSFRDV